jgi:hypothetical protein
MPFRLTNAAALVFALVTHRFGIVAISQILLAGFQLGAGPTGGGETTDGL